jgi:hypothetical protein
MLVSRSHSYCTRKKPELEATSLTPFQTFFYMLQDCALLISALLINILINKTKYHLLSALKQIMGKVFHAYYLI